MAGLHAPGLHCIQFRSCSHYLFSCDELKVGEGWSPSLAPVDKREMVLGVKVHPRHGVLEFLMEHLLA